MKQHRDKIHCDNLVRLGKSTTDWQNEGKHNKHAARTTKWHGMGRISGYVPVRGENAIIRCKALPCSPSGNNLCKMFQYFWYLIVQGISKRICDVFISVLLKKVSIASSQFKKTHTFAMRCYIIYTYAPGNFIGSHSHVTIEF